MNTSPVLLLLILLSACHGEEQVDSNASNIAATMKAQKVETPVEASCPDPTDIEPCVCSNIEGRLFMDCRDIQDEQQLWQVFSADFPTTAFFELDIWDNKGLKVLQNGVFRDVTFQIIDINGGAVETVEDEALSPSLSTLERLSFWNCHLTTFPFESLAEFTSLIFLALDENRIPSIPPLSSSSLLNLELDQNPISSLPPHVFKGLSTIRRINLSGCQLTEITPGTFVDLPKLESVILENNMLSYLHNLTFDIVSSEDYPGSINLKDNNITVVEVDAFKGVQDFSNIYMDNNALTSLPERVWRPLLEREIKGTFKGNPLTCGCDVAWLVRNPQLLTGAKEAQCADGKYLTDLDPADFNMCD